MDEANKPHRAPKKGAKALKKRDKKGKVERKNPRAFGVANVGRTKRNLQRNLDIAQRKEYVPQVNRTIELAYDGQTDETQGPLPSASLPASSPPFLVVVMGPSGSGKTTLIRCLVKYYARYNLGDPGEAGHGPITVVTGSRRRMTLMECPVDTCAMLDLAKVADLVLLMVNASFGFEMETFEFMNMLQVHGFPKVMGVFTHTDAFRTPHALRRACKKLKSRFWTEVYDGAKTFFLSSPRHGKYPKTEIRNMALHLSRVKFRPLVWRNTHPYIIADRREDLTPPQLVSEDPNCDRDVALYGFVRGTHFRQGGIIHLLGGGDFKIEDITRLSDPCPLLDSSGSGAATPSRTTLKSKKVLIYAPLADVGGVKMDEDAMYIDIGRANYTKKDYLVKEAAKGGDNYSGSELEYDDSDESSVEGGDTNPSNMLRNLQGVQVGVDAKLQESEMKLFSTGKAIRAGDVAQRLMNENSESDEGESHEPGENHHLVGTDTATNVTDWDEEGEEICVDGDESWDDDEEEEEEDTPAVENSGNGLGAPSSLISSVVENWRDGIAARAASRFLERARSNVNLMELVYGVDAYTPSSRQQHQSTTESRSRAAATDTGKDDGDDELFQLKKNKRRMPSTTVTEASANTTITTTMHEFGEFDSSKMSRDYVLSKESEEKFVQNESMLRNRFVTGNWGSGGNNGKTAAEEGEEDVDKYESDGSDLYGSYEDLETGEKFDGRGLNGSISEQPIGSSVDEQRAANAAKKAAAMAAKSETQTSDDENETDNSEDGGKEQEEEEEDPFLVEARRSRATQSYRNKMEFALETGERRAALEGHRLGHYVRIKLKGVPAALVRGCFSKPGVPLVVGGLLVQETGMGMIRCRVKRHRWSPGILKSNDPLVVSVGWRRFQTMPIYAMEDNDGRHKFLKYTPEHMHCICVFHGPVCPPTTGIIAMQHVGSKAGSALGNLKGQRFGISLTGTLLELDASLRVVKKLKLVGHPQKIYKKTAFISGMFNSDLEASRFEGAALRTVSGLRGAVKKAVQGGGGSFRSTFEDRLLMSDIVFLRLWLPIEPVHYYNPVTSLLGEELEWRGVKTTAMLRREHGVPVPISKDSLYKPDASEREIRRFNPLPVPESLSKALPFASKPKLQAKRRNNASSAQGGPKTKYLAQRTVVLEPRERQKVALMQAISTIRKEKVQIRKAAAARKRDERSKAQERKGKAFAPLTAHRKKAMYREMGQKQAAEARKRY